VEGEGVAQEDSLVEFLQYTIIQDGLSVSGALLFSVTYFFILSCIIRIIRETEPLNLNPMRKIEIRR
jgi:hypothetical protein